MPEQHSTQQSSHQSPYTLTKLPSVHYVHADPLGKILRSPTSIATSGATCCEADAQSNRVGSGFALSLRAAGIASTDGELKIGFSVPTAAAMGDSSDTNHSEEEKVLIQQLWKKDLVTLNGENDGNNNNDSDKKKQASNVYFDDYIRAQGSSVCNV